jgi:RND family efflux transporter MFP subunit
MVARPRSLAFALIASALLATPACGESANAHGGRGGHGGGKQAEEPMPIVVTAMSAETIDRYYRASGTLQALRWAEIRPVQSGILRDLSVDEGDQVTAGQILARLDGRELSLLAKRDNLAARNASRELDRLQSIADKNAIAREELDKQVYELETAKASAKLSKHQASLSTVRAPFDGTIVARKVDEGNLATNTSVLFELADLRALELDLHLPEREAAHVKLEALVEVELVDGTKFNANVVRRSPVVDATTGTVKFTVRSETFPASAVPGSFVRARVLLESRAGASSLPRTAVFQIDGNPHVYVVVEGKAQRIPVTLGIEGDDQVEITDGITQDQTVVVDASGMTDGMALTPVEADAEPVKEPGS